MSIELDAVEERIKRLEKYVLGENVGRQDDEQLIDTMLAVSRKLANIVSKNEKVSAALKRADEVKKYTDPLYAESDGFMPEPVKLQLLLSKEEDIKEALNHYQKMNLLKPVLDSQAIQNVPQLENQLYKISLLQENQEKKVSSLSGDTYTLIRNYSNFVNDVSQKLAEVEKSISKISNETNK